MSATWWWLIVPAYVSTAAAADRWVHGVVYPLVGLGHPLVGWRRWALRAAAPAVALCIPVIAIAILVGLLFVEASTGPGRRTGRR